MKMTLFRTFLGAALACGAIGCDDRAGLPTGTAVGSTTTAKGGTNGSETTDPGNGTTVEPLPVDATPRPAACDATGGSELTFANEADAQARLIGRWVLCSGPGLTFATEQPNQGGMELGNKSWHVLRRDGATMARADGFQASGTFRINQPQELNFGPSKEVTLFFGIDWSFADVSMLDSPRKLRIQFSAPLSEEPSIYAFVPQLLL